MTKSQELFERQKKVVFPAATPYYGDRPIGFSHAKDQYVWDVDGNRYLDFFGGVLTVSIGHCNEYVTRRVIEQVQKANHISTLYVSEIMVQLAEKLAQISPGRLQYSYFTNSGTEANETAIMAARMYTGNSIVIALRHAYSGRSMMAMSVTAHGTWRLGNVFDGNVRHIRNPYMYRAPEGIDDEDKLVDLVVKDLEEVLAGTTNGKVAAFIAEPIQGVGGFITPPPDFFKRIVPIIKAAGGVFIADEVQTGWGRTGHKWFGIEQWDVEPDIMTSAKGMANGTPIGWTITTPEIAEAVKGATFSTFGGNPVTMVAALATIEYIEQHNLLENAAVQGAVFRERLEELKAEFDFIGDVRGMGLMQAMEIVKPGTNKEPDPVRATAFLNKTREQGILVGKGGLYGNVIRISPHLNVSAEDMQAGCDMIARAAADVG
jgi:4-aminobutyrate aminotransferase-like enzyme